jgi:hypothetical protein
MDVVGTRSVGEVEKNADIRDHGTTEETAEGTALTASASRVEA